MGPGLGLGTSLAEANLGECPYSPLPHPTSPDRVISPDSFIPSSLVKHSSLVTITSLCGILVGPRLHPLDSEIQRGPGRSMGGAGPLGMI